MAEYNGFYYLDLCDDERRVVEITPEGWNLLESNVPVHFRRGNTKPLPVPQGGGHIDLLRRFTTFSNESDQRLFVGALLAMLHPTGPYPILYLAGEMGSRKSIHMDVARELVDPHVAGRRGPPRNEEDLVIYARNSHLLTFDNVSFLKEDLPDAFCRLVTGGGLGKRRLYTDEDEHVIEVIRPVVLNGINPPTTRQDFLDRTILLNLEPMDGDERLTEVEFWRMFREAQPLLLGVLLDACVDGLRRAEDVRPSSLPRMADIVAWVEACGGALGWEDGTFADAYELMRGHILREAVEADVFIAKLLEYLNSIHKFDGTVTELLDVVNSYVGQDASERDNRAWPKSARSLGHKLQRVQPALKTMMRVEHQVLVPQVLHRLHRNIDTDAGRAAGRHSSPSAENWKSAATATAGSRYPRLRARRA